MDFNASFDKAVSQTLTNTFPGINSLKDGQATCVKAFLQKQDVFARLPTGWGKSLCFQIIPLLCERLHKEGFNFPEKAILIVVCPLTALVENHIEELDKLGVSACSLSDEKLDERRVKAGEYSFVFTSPESLDNPKWRNMIKSETYQEKMFGLVTDEAHVVPKWGQGSTKERTAAFRVCFGRLGDIRSLLPEGSPFLALTATATEEVKRKTVKALALKADHLDVYISPNRENIYLHKETASGDLECFNWVIDTLAKEGVHAPKTIIYCRKQNDCGAIYSQLMYKLGRQAYYPDGAEKLSKNCLVGMFHSNPG